MGNECYIKNTKKEKPKEILLLLQKELKNKFNLDSVIELDLENNYMAVIVKDLVFPMYFEKNRISFNDTAWQSFSRSHKEEHPYWKNMGVRGDIMGSFLTVYEYLHEYLKHFLAQHNKTFLDSDGAGPYEPFEKPEKYASYRQWFEFWKNNHKKRGLLARAFLPNHNKVKKQELEKFPELRF